MLWLLSQWLWYITERHYHWTCDVMFTVTSSMNDVLRNPTNRSLALEGWFEKSNNRLFGHVRVKFKLFKTIYFLKRTWFLYVLWKYQEMFKVLQWNARQWKTPTLKIAVIPGKFNIYRSYIKSTIEVLNYN